MSRNALIIFTKNPELGKVKTRLAKSVGDAEALRIYKLMIKYTQNITQSVNADLLVYYSSKIDFSDSWQAKDRKLQATGDLGAKIATAFQNELKTYEKVCIIGTDNPELNAIHINTAFDQLSDYDHVIGPANDGGYYLLGMSSFESSIFENINWSTPEVLSMTTERLISRGKSIYYLPELIDVDTISDWELVKEKLE